MTTPGYRGRRVSHAEFARMWADRSLTRVQIAAALGISRQAVTDRARARGLPPRSDTGGRPPTRVNDADLRDMWAAGVSPREIAGLYGVSPGVIWRAAARLGLPPHDRAWMPKITLADWRAQRALSRLAAETAAALRERDMVDVIAKRAA